MVRKLLVPHTANAEIFFFWFSRMCALELPVRLLWQALWSVVEGSYILASYCAIKVGIDRPALRNDKQQAGNDWRPFFSYRHNLSLSVARWGRYIFGSIGSFLSYVLTISWTFLKSSRFLRRISAIWMKLGVTTLHEQVRVVAHKGSKTVGRIESTQKYTDVTLECAINETWKSVLPFFFFWWICF